MFSASQLKIQASKLNMERGMYLVNQVLYKHRRVLNYILILNYFSSSVSKSEQHCSYLATHSIEFHIHLNF